MRVERNKIVIACPLQISDHAIVTVTIEVDTIHIGGDGITKIEVEYNVLDGEVGGNIENDGIVGRILYSKVRNFKVSYIVKKHHMTEITITFKFSGIDGIRALIHIIEVPNTALNLKVVASILRIGRKLVTEAPEKL
jgi:hypothetical protein